MAKLKAKAPTSLPNKNVHLRLAYLHQAARYLNSQAKSSTASNGPKSTQSRQLCSHMKAISKRSVVRLDRSIKRQICKGCDSMLLDERAAVKYVENNSRHGAKASASIEVVECTVCGRKKRFPVSVQQTTSDVCMT